MIFEYSHTYKEPYTYNGQLHQFDPYLPVPVPPEDADYGKSLKDVVGMTDAEASAIVLEQKWIQVRDTRDQLLKETDWVSGEDVPQSIKDLYFPYRQELRDITSTYASPDDVVFPTKP